MFRKIVLRDLCEWIRHDDSVYSTRVFCDGKSASAACGASGITVATGGGERNL